MKLHFTIVVALSLGLLVNALVCLNFELSGFGGAAGTPAQRFTRLESGAARAGVSIFNKNLILFDCLEAINDFHGRAQPTVRRTAVVNHCHDVARDIAFWNPSFGLAWLVAAYASNEQGSTSDLNLELTAAQRTAANEQWLAEPRVQLAERARDKLNAEALESEQNDLLLLAQSRRGVRTIAARYVNDPDFRERITALVETLPPPDQQRFLSFVQLEAKAYARTKN